MTKTKAMAPHSSTLAWKNPMGGGAWWAIVHGVAKSWTRLSDFPFTFHLHALEKEMTTHSSVLAWRIPGTGEPGGLPPVGSHRVGHDWGELAIAAARIVVKKKKKKFVLFSFLRIPDPPVSTLRTQTHFSSLGTLNFLSICLGIGSLNLQAATKHWAECPVPYSRSLLVIHLKYSRVYMSIPNSLSIPSHITSPPSPHWQP